MKSIVATCQFPVSEDIRRNARHILRQLAVTKDSGATVAHFPECGPSGYAGADFASLSQAVSGIQAPRLAAHVIG
jgi:predicted amidohydrolase